MQQGIQKSQNFGGQYSIGLFGIRDTRNVGLPKLTPVAMARHRSEEEYNRQKREQQAFLAAKYPVTVPAGRVDLDAMEAEDRLDRMEEESKARRATTDAMRIARLRADERESGEYTLFDYYEDQRRENGGYINRILTWEEA